MNDGFTKPFVFHRAMWDTAPVGITETSADLGRLYFRRPGSVRAAVQRVQATLSAAGLTVPMAEIAATAIEQFEPETALELFKHRLQRNELDAHAMAR